MTIMLIITALVLGFAFLREVILQADERPWFAALMLVFAVVMFAIAFSPLWR